MKKQLSVLMLTAFIMPVVFGFAQAKEKAPVFKKSDAGAKSDSKSFTSFNVYTDAGDKGNHFIPSGWMGDYNDMLYTDKESSDPYLGKTCIKIVYKAQGSQGWAGIYWQYPANNWGTTPKSGFDLTGAKKLTFWAKGQKGGEVLTKVLVGGIKGEHPDSDEAAVHNILLTKEWAPYSIDLNNIDLSYITGGFCVVFARDANPEGAVIYLDNIVYVGK